MKRSVHGTKMLFIRLYLLYGMERRTIFEAGYQRMKLLRTREYSSDATTSSRVTLIFLNIF